MVIIKNITLQYNGSNKLFFKYLIYGFVCSKNFLNPELKYAGNTLYNFFQ